MRDLFELSLSERDGVTWAWLSGMLYTPADATARFPSCGTKQVLAAAETDGTVVYWPGGVSMAVSEIIETVAR